jgi:hypothetical protein
MPSGRKNLSTGPRTITCPNALRDASDGRDVEYQLDVEEASWEELQDAAKREGTSTERLLEHAVLLLIADLDSGRVARRFVAPAGELPLDWEE